MHRFGLNAPDSSRLQRVVPGIFERVNVSMFEPEFIDGVKLLGGTGALTCAVSTIAVVLFFSSCDSDHDSSVPITPILTFM